MLAPSELDECDFARSVVNCSGRCHFRWQDLIQLAEVITAAQGGREEAMCKANFAATVKETAPGGLAMLVILLL